MTKKNKGLKRKIRDTDTVYSAVSAIGIKIVRLSLRRTLDSEEFCHNSKLPDRAVWSLLVKEAESLVASCRSPGFSHHSASFIRWDATKNDDWLDWLAEGLRCHEE